MKLQDNIYFQSYEYGFNHPEGVTYNELVQYLSSKGHSFDKNRTSYFQHWFFLNFFSGSATWQVQRLEHGEYSHGNVNLRDYLDTKAVMTGEALLRYVDMVELMQTREQAAEANRNANKSIQLAEEASRNAEDSTRTAKHSLWATLAALALTIILGLWQGCSNSNQSHGNCTSHQSCNHHE